MDDILEKNSQKPRRLFLILMSCSFFCISQEFTLVVIFALPNHHSSVLSWGISLVLLNWQSLHGKFTRQSSEVCGKQQPPSNKPMYGSPQRWRYVAADSDPDGQPAQAQLQGVSDSYPRYLHLPQGHASAEPRLRLRPQQRSQAFRLCEFYVVLRTTTLFRFIPT